MFEADLTALGTQVTEMDYAVSEVASLGRDMQRKIKREIRT